MKWAKILVLLFIIAGCSMVTSNYYKNDKMPILRITDFQTDRSRAFIYITISNPAPFDRTFDVICRYEDRISAGEKRVLIGKKSDKRISMSLIMRDANEVFKCTLHEVFMGLF